jgi:hypothetical protein
MRLSHINFRRDAWWLVLMAAVVPLGVLTFAMMWYLFNHIAS